MRREKQKSTPGENQGSLYNGHVRQHGLKYQAVVAPDGITVSLCGPFAVGIHDMNMLDSSDIVSELDEILDCEDIGDKFYALYGDPAYRPSSCLIRPYLTGLALTDNQRSTKPGQKVFLSRVGLLYVVSTLLKNVHTCVNNGNQTSSYFGLSPPTLQQYNDSITNML
ncbi:hypothetical protein INT47_012145 [Mucor saturninus]|uniref:DDE Tnp4 domain-containing protein n=1 Tax=Mucor saturninus TaxID=64648 RepID=A0A8H7QJW1_9FUNG|nr:hypothetical protein INT47_012145 [Mucor saturninus]